MNVYIRQLVYKFPDMEQQFKTKSNISSKLLEHHQQSNMSDYITERLLSIHSPRLYFEGLEVNRGVGGGSFRVRGTLGNSWWGRTTRFSKSRP